MGRTAAERSRTEDIWSESCCMKGSGPKYKKKQRSRSMPWWQRTNGQLLLMTQPSEVKWVTPYIRRTSNYKMLCGCFVRSAERRADTESAEQHSSGTKSVLSIRTKPGHWFHSSHPAGVQMKETSLCSSFPAGRRLLSAFQEVLGDEKMSFMSYSNGEPASPHSHIQCLCKLFHTLQPDHTFLIGPTRKPLYYKRLRRWTDDEGNQNSACVIRPTVAIMLIAADLILKMRMTLSSFVVSSPNNTVRNICMWVQSGRGNEQQVNISSLFHVLITQTKAEKGGVLNKKLLNWFYLLSPTEQPWPRQTRRKHDIKVETRHRNLFSSGGSARRFIWGQKHILSQ